MKTKKSNVSIQFIQGVNETSIPEIRLRRSPDGKKGQAIFKFKGASVFSVANVSDIKGMYLIDDEGQISTRDINIRVSNNKNNNVEAIYKWKTDSDFTRFIRFATRYAKENGTSHIAS